MNNKECNDICNDNQKGGYNHWHNEIISSFASGSLAGFLTNGIEILCVNK